MNIPYFCYFIIGCQSTKSFNEVGPELVLAEPFSYLIIFIALDLINKSLPSITFKTYEKGLIELDGTSTGTNDSP